MFPAGHGAASESCSRSSPGVLRKGSRALEACSPRPLGWGSSGSAVTARPGGRPAGSRRSGGRSSCSPRVGGGRRVCHGAPATSAPVDHASRTGWGRTARLPRRSGHDRAGSLSLASLLRNRDRLGFLYPKCHCEGRSAAGTPRLEDGGKPFVMPALPPGSWRREGHGASLPVMRASAREEMRRISLTIRSSSRLFAIHSRYRTSSSSVSFKPTVFPRALRVQWW